MRTGKVTRFVFASLSALFGFCLILLAIYLPEWANAPEHWSILRISCIATGATLLLGGLFFLGGLFLFIYQLSVKPEPNPDLQDADLETCLNNLKALKQKLVLQEKMVQVGLLTAGIAHEIKNPLNFVTNFSSTSIEILDELKESFNNYLKSPSDNHKEDMLSIIEDLTLNIQKISEHGQRAQSIVMNMLMQARAENELENESVDINQLLKEYLNLAYHGLRAQDPSFNIKIESDFQESAGHVYGKSQSIGRVFLNIINNGMFSAYKITENNPDHKPLIKISTMGDENQAIIRIRDNGEGIKKEHLDRIFMPFFTTKPQGQGTGLGLSICHDIIVKEYRGEIKVDSKPEEYTEFTIILPKQKKAEFKG